jgi:hypothetical protein
MSKRVRLAFALLAGIGACTDSSRPDASLGDAHDVVTDGMEPADAPMDDAILADDGADDASRGPSDRARLDALVAQLRSTTDDPARRTLVTAFVRDVAYGASGFPIRDGNEVAFVFWDPDNMPGSVAVSGDYDAWASEPMMQPVSGFPFYLRIDTIARPATRSLYKFIRGGTIYFADPSARRFGYDSNGEYSLLEPGTDGSHLERWPDFADHAGTLRARDLLVYVPRDAFTTPRPVLYMHDGQNLFDPGAIWGGWHVGDAADAAIASGEVEPFYIVGIANTPERMDEYTHTSDDIGTGSAVGGRASEYVSFLVDGIKPFVDARYATRSDRAHTGVMGSSLGGLVSVFIAMERPTVFGFAGSMSGTFGWGSIGGTYNRTLMARYASGALLDTIFYVDSGGSDGGGCTDSDGDGVHDDTTGAADNYCETLDMITVLHARGLVDGSSLFYSTVLDAQHNEAAWAARFPAAIRTWFPAQR